PGVLVSNVPPTVDEVPPVSSSSSVTVETGKVATVAENVPSASGATKKLNQAVWPPALALVSSNSTLFGTPTLSVTIAVDVPATQPPPVQDDPIAVPSVTEAFAAVGARASADAPTIPRT